MRSIAAWRGMCMLGFRVSLPASACIRVLICLLLDYHVLFNVNVRTFLLLSYRYMYMIMIYICHIALYSMN